MVPALLTALLGVWRLTVPALWADELATWGVVRLSWAKLWALSGSVDAVVTPYYVALKLWTTLAGTGTAALRLPSLLACVLATVAVTAVGRRLGGDLAGLLGGLIFAVLPVTSRYAQEARPYAFSMLFAAVALWALLRLLDRQSAGRAVTYAAATALAGLAHPLSGMLMLAGHAVAIAWRQLVTRPGGWRTSWWWLGAAVAGAVPGLVLLVIGNRQRGQVSWIALANQDALQGLPQNVFVSAAVGGMVLALAAVGVRGGEPERVATAAGFVPPALLLAVGTVVPVWVGRYVMVAVPVLSALAAAGALSRAREPRRGWLPAAAVVAMTALFAYPVQLELREPAGHSQDSASIAGVIGPRYREGDVAVFPDTHPSIPWAARDIYERYLPAPRPPDVLAVRGQRADGRMLAEECPAASCLGTPPRIWVIRVDSASDPLKDMAPGKRKRISDGYRTEQSWKFRQLGITLLVRRDAK